MPASLSARDLGEVRALNRKNGWLGALASRRRVHGMDYASEMSVLPGSRRAKRSSARIVMCLPTACKPIGSVISLLANELGQTNRERADSAVRAPSVDAEKNHLCHNSSSKA
jgi:hypothetical protein